MTPEQHQQAARYALLAHELHGSSEAGEITGELAGKGIDMLECAIRADLDRSIDDVYAVIELIQDGLGQGGKA